MREPTFIDQGEASGAAHAGGTEPLSAPHRGKR